MKLRTRGLSTYADVSLIKHGSSQINTAWVDMSSSHCTKQPRYTRLGFVVSWEAALDWDSYTTQCAPTVGPQMCHVP